MRKHTDFPSLVEKLPELVHQQRRLLAAQLRVTTEERALRANIAALLDAAGATEVTCEVTFADNTTRDFEIRPYQSSRDGTRRVKVFPRR
jgi:predicted GNAT superfamily acetyltransferase